MYEKRAKFSPVAGHFPAFQNLFRSRKLFFFFFLPATTCTITKSAATSRYRSISPMFRVSPFDDYFLRGAFVPSPMEAIESRMAVSAMVFFIS